MERLARVQVPRPDLMELKHDRAVGSKAEPLARVKRDRIVARIRTKISTGWGLFHDPETGETVGSDTREAVGNIRSMVTTSPSKRFEYEVKATAARHDAEAVAMDSCYEETDKRRIEKLRVAHELYALADQYEWKAQTSPTIRERVLSLTKKFQGVVDSEITEIDSRFFAEAVEMQGKYRTTEDRKRLEEIRKGINSPKTRKYMYQKLRERRVKMIMHVIGAAGAAAVAGALWWAGSAIGDLGPGVGDAIHGIAGIAMLGIIHQANNFRIEWIKMRAVLNEVERRFADSKRVQRREKNSEESDIMREALIDIQR